MRIAFLYGSFSLGQRPLDFDNLYTSPRGLTGSELSCVEYAQAMQRRGHDVSLLVGQPQTAKEWRGIQLRQHDNPKLIAECDVVYAWNEPDLLRQVPAGPLRMANQQLNDFAYCQAGWEEHVDVVTSPSAHHLEFLKKQAPNVRAWEVQPNGCDPTQYAQDKRIDGRVIWASSADRGLHRLLEMWPEIKRCVPHASLRCFYNFQAADFDDYEATGPNVHPDLLEIAQRKRYIRYAMSKLAGPKWDVEHVGSVSRDRMREEFEHAQVLAYPCDTIRYTEGFSVTTLEACASGCLPVITDIDALGDIYGGAAPMTKLGINHAEFVSNVVAGLTDPDWRAGHVAGCRAFAEHYAWNTLAERLEQVVSVHNVSMKGAAE